MASKVISAIKEACDEESKRWNKDTITFDYKMLVDVSAGDQDIHAPIAEAFYAIIKYLGYKPKFAERGSTNANNAIGAGILALCLGVGEIDNKTHTLEEFFPKAKSHELVQETFYLC